MNNQPRNLANKVANADTVNNNDNDNDDNDNEVMSANVSEEEEKQELGAEDTPNQDKAEDEQIKNVELTGKDAMGMNQTNSGKKGILANNTLTKKKNNNATQLSRNLTQKQSPSVNVSTEEGTSAKDDKNVMRSLNKVAMNLLNHQIVMKLFHFQTELYGAHKASDAYLEKFATTMDKFLEIAQGIYGRLTIKKFKLEGSSHSDDNIMKHIEGIINLLRTGIDDVLDNYTDLINVRDELVGDAEQLKYLLSFK
jgi:hypothetical protein